MTSDGSRPLASAVRRLRALLAVLVVAVLAVAVLAGCTGVPAHSTPQTVEPLGGDVASTGAAPGPAPGAGPGALVDSFLDANVTSPTGSAKWLTAFARTQWTHATVTVIADRSTSIYDPRKHSVSFTARNLGALDADGVYSPQLLGDGDGAPQTFKFGVTSVGGQFRINLLQKGLLIDADDFGSHYQHHNLYFYDRANRYLVPDLRYSPLQSPAELANWLLDQLLAGPQQELQNSVNTDTLPGQARVRLTIGDPTRVVIPGAMQLAGDVRDRLAAQLSATLGGVLHGAQLRIDDGSEPVRIPAARGALFTSADFPTATGPPTPAPDVYYLRDGHIHTGDGRALGGPVNDYSLKSVALARPPAIGQLAIAAVQAYGPAGRLLVGTEAGGLRPTTVRGQLSRPAWAPGLGEVWVGDGSQLIAVTTNGRTSKAVVVSVPSAVGGQRIVAVRFSPDGGRVALVVSNAVSGQNRAVLLVGPVVRTGTGPPQIATLQPISPDGVVPTDVAWFDSTHLIATGRLAGSDDARIFDTLVDGSAWEASGTGNLPEEPNSLTAATGQFVWVSTPGGFVWEQPVPSSWVSPSASGQTSGTAPIYLS